MPYSNGMTSLLRQRLSDALASAAHGPLGDRRLTDILRITEPLIREARGEREPWERIAVVVSDTLEKQGRPPVDPATLRGIMRRIGTEQIAPSSGDAALPNMAVRALRPAKPKNDPWTPILEDGDLNRQSQGRPAATSSTRAERIRALRALNHPKEA